MRAVVLAASLLVCSASLRAQPQLLGIDVSTVGTFVYEFFSREMPRRQIPGAVFVLVFGGEIAIARGFGAAQLEPHRPVDPTRTMFRLGFDERLTGAGARSADDVQPSSRYLARSMPPTFIEPGRVISYSNHGFALIGHLVEETSGLLRLRALRGGAMRLEDMRNGQRALLHNAGGKGFAPRTSFANS